MAVSDGVLTNCITELRQALGDDARRPRFIATVHRRGDRFFAPLSSPAPPVRPSAPAPALLAESGPPPPPAPPPPLQSRPLPPPRTPAPLLPGGGGRTPHTCTACTRTPCTGSDT